jgi:hypothetical protein
VAEAGVAADRYARVSRLRMLAITVLDTEIINLSTVANGQADYRIRVVAGVARVLVVFDYLRFAFRC